MKPVAPPQFCVQLNVEPPPQQLTLPSGGQLSLESYPGPGASSNVYSCRDPLPGSRFASKVARTPGSTPALQNEHDVLVRLSEGATCGNIPRVEALRSGIRPTLLLQPVGAVLTAELLREHERGVFNLLPHQLVAALRHCHDHGYVHRDIRPANMIMTTAVAGLTAHSPPKGFPPADLHSDRLVSHPAWGVA